MRRSIVAFSLAGLLLAGCSSPTDDVPDDAPTPVESDGTPEPAADALDAIVDLPAVSLRSLELPEVPEGLDEVDVRTAADTVRSLAFDAFSNRTRWDAGPTTEVQRSHLSIAGPDFPEQVETSEVLSAGAPTAQLFVSIFDPDDQPLELPRVVGAAWDVREAQGENGPAPFVSLQVHAIYFVGSEEEPRPILVRRTIGIGGNDLGRLDAEKDWLVQTELVGADECTFYSEGLIAHSDEDPQPQAYEEFLAEAESDEQDSPAERTPDLAELRDASCS